MSIKHGHRKEEGQLNSPLYRSLALDQSLTLAPIPLPMIDDILPESAGARVYLVANARIGFWHVRLDEENSLLTTMATPFGRFR